HERRAPGAACDGAIDESRATRKDVQLLMHHIRIVSGRVQQSVFEQARAIDDAAEAVGEDAEDGGDAGEEEDGRDRRLDRVSDVDANDGRHHAATNFRPASINAFSSFGLHASAYSRATCSVPESLKSSHVESSKISFTPSVLFTSRTLSPSTSAGGLASFAASESFSCCVSFRSTRFE